MDQQLTRVEAACVVPQLAQVEIVDQVPFAIDFGSADLQPDAASQLVQQFGKQ